ncbi:TraB/VirB10 family protein [Xanthomonas hortorum pv. pelargonii]|uniref:TraB/VirB10 family protein n=1 Tax=Xanthomonas hortorum TaxID=56454 RepID=UPI0021C6E4E5|nr:TraB/VirB10 family protein [Xanthomonas hortorum]MCU1709600.1 TraB/VirB10 family protein [Xanthomonas hortorum pv. pelargonii]WCI07224.1 TraB/VirB10 family protein [Xanthomonas hortorum pv. pelargonii]WOB33040.1 TraB/VirB10 family protein [Xanthomonas hortorum pv. pelargonii]
MKKNGVLQQKWESMPAGQKKIAITVGIFGSLILVCMLIVILTGGSDKPRKERVAASRIENALLPGGDSAKKMGLSSLPREIDAMSRDRARDKEMIDKLKSQVESQAQGDSGASQAQEATQALRKEVTEIRDVVEQLVKLQQANGAAGAGPAGQGAPGAGTPVGQPAPQAYGGIRTIGAPQVPSSVTSVPVSAPLTAPRSDSAGTVDAPPKAAQETEAGNQAETYTPSGSMIQGVLLTGLDAPTGQGAMKEPTPVLIRVKKESILPNRYLADFRECMILAGGHGDLASERAMLRAENLSCIRTDRSVIDVKLQGWVVGNDGKAGVRGRLVSKQGAVLAKASLAGVADGISQAFSGNVRGVAPGNGIDSAYAAQSGAFGGASTALDRIAEYYLNLADQMHPVIEIDAGREVTLVLVRGISLPPLRARTPAK